MMITAQWLTPAEAGQALRVTTPTLIVWAKKGLITSIVTPSGHRRYLASEVIALVNGERKDS